MRNHCNVLRGYMCVDMGPTDRIVVNLTYFNVTEIS